MAVYEYTARTATGDETTGTMEASTREEVVQQLRRNRMMVVRIREQRKRRKGGRVPTRDVVVFTRQFATMVNSVIRGDQASGVRRGER
jgi:type IV pilus assembly protein PilC